MNEISADLKKLPISYRLSRFGAAGGILIFVVAKPLVINWPGGLRTAILSFVVLSIGVALLTTCYVVIRYPFLSLCEDPDEYSHDFSIPKGSPSWVLIKGTVLLTLGTIVVAAWFGNGLQNFEDQFRFAYVVVLLLFTCFLIFVYHHEKHPTVSTFLRSTCGIGVILAPFFLPILLVGSIRCRRLLNAAMSEE